MTTDTLHGAAVQTQANVYFDGKCISHNVTLPDGTRKSVGVVLPSTLRFNTQAAEVMECVAGACTYKMQGAENWLSCAQGEQFAIAANSAFDIQVTDAFHYICHYES